MVCGMGSKRIGVGCAVVNRMLYAVGGFDGQRRLASVERYHPENDEWCFVKSMQVARSGAGGFCSYFLICGLKITLFGLCSRVPPLNILHRTK